MAMHKHQDEDTPRWLKSRWDTKCKECKCTILEGDQILWDPKTKQVLCEDCGKEYN